MKEDKKSFYKAVGAIVQRERLASGMTVGELGRAANEQHKTIKMIEEGKPFMMHHLEWMHNILGIELYNINTGSSNVEESFKITCVQDLI